MFKRMQYVEADGPTGAEAIERAKKLLPYGPNLDDYKRTETLLGRTTEPNAPFHARIRYVPRPGQERVKRRPSSAGPADVYDITRTLL